MIKVGDVNYYNTQGVCPHCGYCPHCGRGGYVQPYYIPTNPPYYQPVWIGTPFTQGSVSTGAQSGGSLKD